MGIALTNGENLLLSSAGLTNLFSETIEYFENVVIGP